jgi:hypothetical protein
MMLRRSLKTYASGSPRAVSDGSTAQVFYFVDDATHDIAVLADALGRLTVAAKMLHANSVGCAVNHHGIDFETHGLPGWLSDAQRDIDRAVAILEAKP